MIIGHVGIAAASSGAWPRTDWRWLVAACVLPDALDLVYAAAGVCNPSGLMSHTVPAALLAAACLAAMALVSVGRATALVVVLVVMLHLPADYVTGHKLFWPGGELHGLDLYARPAIDFVVEAVLLAAGLWWARRAASTPRWSTSTAVLLLLLAVQGAADVASAYGVSGKPSACARAAASSAEPG